MEASTDIPIKVRGGLSSRVRLCSSGAPTDLAALYGAAWSIVHCYVIVKSG